MLRRVIPKVWYSLIYGAGVASALLIAFVVFGTIADVISRNVTGSSLPGLTAYVELAVAASVFLALAVTERESGMIRVELITNRMTAAHRKRASIASNVIGVAVCFFLVWAAASAAIQAYESGEATIGLISVESWPGRLAVFVGLSLFLIELLRSTWKSIVSNPSKPNYEEILNV